MFSENVFQQMDQSRAQRASDCFSAKIVSENTKLPTFASIENAVKPVKSSILEDSSTSVGLSFVTNVRPTQRVHITASYLQKTCQVGNGRLEEENLPCFRYRKLSGRFFRNPNS